MKLKNQLILTIAFALSIVLQSCNSNCICTEVACTCPELSIQVEANLDNEESGSFTNHELNEFYVVRTDLGFEIIDSIKIEFDNIVGNVDYNKFYWINENKFPDFTSLKDYYFILRNHETGYSDTITNIDYNESTSTTTCNQCSNCEDEKITCTQFDDFKLDHNGETQTDNSVRLLK